MSGVNSYRRSQHHRYLMSTKHKNSPIRGPDFLKELSMRIQRQINASVSIMSVQRSMLGIFVNLVCLDELEGLQNDKSKPPPKRVWGHTYSLVGEGNCVEKADELPPA